MLRIGEFVGEMLDGFVKLCCYGIGFIVGIGFIGAVIWGFLSIPIAATKYIFFG